MFLKIFKKVYLMREFIKRKHPKVFKKLKAIKNQLSNIKIVTVLSLAVNFNFRDIFLRNALFIIVSG